MGFLLSILGLGTVVLILLAFAAWILGEVLATLPFLALALSATFLLGLPIWLWLEFGWGGIAFLVGLAAVLWRALHREAH